MSSQTNLVSQTIVARILREYLNECGDNYNLYHAGDISKTELIEQLLLLDQIYAQKVLEAV